MKVGDHDEADHRSRDDVHQRQGRDGRQHQQEYDGSDASIADTGARYLFLQEPALERELTMKGFLGEGGSFSAALIGLVEVV